MKVVFLDIDGVLNTPETFYKRDIIGLEIDLFRLKYLKEILDKTDSKLVLSSSWRNRNFFNNAGPKTTKGMQLCRLLDEFGIRIDYVTPYLPDKKRSDEIKLWLDSHDVENFLILDDEPNLFDDLFDNMIITSKLNKNQILMYDCNGLCEDDIEKAVNILNKKSKVKRK